MPNCKDPALEKPGTRSRHFKTCSSEASELTQGNLEGSLFDSFPFLNLTNLTFS